MVVLGFPLDALIHSLAERRILHKGLRITIHVTTILHFFTQENSSFFDDFYHTKGKLKLQCRWFSIFNRMMTDYDNLFSFRRNFKTHCQTLFNSRFLSFILLTVFFLNSMLFLIAMAITSHVVLENTTD